MLDAREYGGSRRWECCKFSRRRPRQNDVVRGHDNAVKIACQIRERCVCVCVFYAFVWFLCLFVHVCVYKCLSPCGMCCLGYDVTVPLVYSLFIYSGKKIDLCSSLSPCCLTCPLTFVNGYIFKPQAQFSVLHTVWITVAAFVLKSCIDIVVRPWWSCVFN